MVTEKILSIGSSSDTEVKAGKTANYYYKYTTPWNSTVMQNGTEAQKKNILYVFLLIFILKKLLWLINYASYLFVTKLF